MLPLSARRISSSLGSLSLSSSAFAAITMPGVQKPHCTAPAWPKAYTYASFSNSLSPSVVIICLPPSLSVRCTQAFIARPSIITVHVPHAPSLQPSFTEVSRSSSLR